MTPERKAEIEALAKRMDSIVSWPDAAPTLRELLADNERLEAKLAKAKDVFVLARAAVVMGNESIQLVVLPCIDSALSEIEES